MATAAVTEMVHPNDGWALFESMGSTHGSPQIQRDDELEMFDDDVSAWVWVAGQASDGDSRSLAALVDCMHDNPDEFDRVVDAWLMNMGRGLTIHAAQE